jgi:hypothetical protein
MAPQSVGRSQTLATALTADNFPNLFLRCPVPASVVWSQDMVCFLAVDYVFDWHGQGGTMQEALQDLADVITEDYLELNNWPGRLSKPLQTRLNIMKRYFEDAR